MPMYRICKSFTFSAAHRLETSWTKKCQEIHGHNYKIDVILECDSLNKDGMVIDFGELKELISHIISRYDHSFMYVCKDGNPSTLQNTIGLKCNPTSENIARLIFNEVHITIGNMENDPGSFIKLSKVRIYETDTSWSEYSE